MHIPPNTRVGWRTRADNSEQRARLLTFASVSYVHVWILEGVLRKWVPTLGPAFYIGRDVGLICLLCLALVMFGAPRTRNHLSAAVWGCVGLLAIFALSMAILNGTSLPILLFGFRNYLAPALLPLIAARDILHDFPKRAARAIAVHSPVQLLISIIQVTSPSGAPINTQVGGDEAYFTTAYGVVRASGTFSAPAGLVAYLAIAVVVGLAAVTTPTLMNRAAAWSALVATLGTVAISGSRGAVFGSALLFLAWIFYVGTRRRLRLALVAIGACGCTYLILQVIGWALPSVAVAFLVRFGSASESENLAARLAGDIFGFLTTYTSVFGDGIGNHSTIGIALGSGLPWIESDTSRWAAELGAVGVVASALRLGLAFMLAWGLLARAKYSSPLLFLSGVVVSQLLLSGPITTQPSTQGQFAIAAAMFICLARREWTPISQGLPEES